MSIQKPNRLHLLQLKCFSDNSAFALRPGGGEGGGGGGVGRRRKEYFDKV